MNWKMLQSLAVVALAALTSHPADAARRSIYSDPYDGSYGEPYEDDVQAYPPGLDDDDDYEPAPRRYERPSSPHYGAPGYYRAPHQGYGAIAPKFRRQIVANRTGQGPGTIVIDTRAKFLYLVLDGGRAVRYGVGVGRQGFTWKGLARVGRKAEWPDWTPPPEMLERQPYLPDHMEGGPDNPLGARALYLYQGSKDTLFRIHGTNERWSIGRSVSSGCIRMLNEDAIDLYSRVPVGARVVVL